MKTFFRTHEDAMSQRKWVVVDAADQVVGRLASQIATILMGKNKPDFAPHTDCGDFVVVINADKIRFTGNKWEQKKYYHHTGFVGGVVTTKASDLREHNPEQIILNAVKRMLPKTPHGRSQFSKLKVYAGDTHPHQAQVAHAMLENSVN